MSVFSLRRAGPGFLLTFGMAQVQPFQPARGFRPPTCSVVLPLNVPRSAHPAGHGLLRAVGQLGIRPMPRQELLPLL